MHLARLIASLAITFSIATPSVQAARPPEANARYTLEALNNNCQYRDEADCVNVAVTIEYDARTGRGRFCVSTQDNRLAGPPPATGCADSRAITADGREVVVPETNILATLATDCHPGDTCATETVRLRASASFGAVGRAVRFRRAEPMVSGYCHTKTVVTGSRVDVEGTVTVDGQTYQLPGSDPSSHHRSATLVVETTRSTGTCR